MKTKEEIELLIANKIKICNDQNIDMKLRKKTDIEIQTLRDILK